MNIAESHRSAIPRDAGKDCADLHALRQSDGWKLICTEFETRFAALTAEVLKLTTPTEKAEQLRQARGRIELEFKPTQIMTDLLTKQTAAANAQLRQVNGGALAQG